MGLHITMLATFIRTFSPVKEDFLPEVLEDFVEVTK
jgi:hypothetical protein